MSVLITIIIALIVFGLVWYLIGLLPIDARIKKIIQILLILVMIIYLLRMLGIFGGSTVTLG